MHNNINSSSNCKWRKYFNFPNTYQQICGHFSNLMFFLILWILQSCSNRWDVLFCHYVEQEARKSNAHLHKHFITYNKYHETIAMTRHVFTKHSTILSMYKTQKQLATTNIHFDAQQSSNKQKKLIPHSSVRFFSFGILYKKFDLA